MEHKEIDKEKELEIEYKEIDQELEKINAEILSKVNRFNIDTKQETIGDFYKRKFRQFFVPDFDFQTQTYNKIYDITMHKIYEDIQKGNTLTYLDIVPIPFYILLKQVAKVENVDYLELFKKLEDNREKKYKKENKNARHNNIKPKTTN